ncbi:MAG: hypothetical protein ACRD2N_22025 [Vicinamibacterales bacterium]
MPVDGDHIAFFAVDPFAALGLRRNLEEFYGALTPEAYRLKFFDPD